MRERTLPRNRTKPVFPYVHEVDAIEFSWRLEGLGERFGNSPSEIDKVHSDPSEEIRIEFQMRVESSILESLVGEHESCEEALSMKLVVNSAGGMSARRRYGIDASGPDQDGDEMVWSTEWVMKKIEIGGDLSFTPSLVRQTVGNDPMYAMYPGEEVATSQDRLRLLVRDAPPPPGGDIEAIWVGFNNTENEGQPWIISAFDDSSAPVLQLNSDVDRFNEFHQTLESKGTTGRRARQRDLLNAIIASDVRSSLSKALLASQASKNADGNVNDLGYEADDWRYQLLVEVAKVFNDELPPEDGVRSLVNWFRTEDRVIASDKLDRWIRKSMRVSEALEKMVAPPEERV